jgi:hypothetical protein
MPRRTSTDWAAIRFEYVSSSVTYADLAARHGLKDATVRQRGRRDKWDDQRHATARYVTDSAHADVTSGRIDALRAFNSDDLAFARRIRQRLQQMLDDGTAVDEATGEPVRLSPRDLNAIAKAAESAQKIGRLALGVSTENTGHGGPNGIGPVSVTSIPPGEYADALAAALAAF